MRGLPNLRTRKPAIIKTRRKYVALEDEETWLRRHVVRMRRTHREALGSGTPRICQALRRGGGERHVLGETDSYLKARGCVMPIAGLLQQAAFDPEATRILMTAF